MLFELLLIIIVLVIFGLKSVKILRPYEKGVIERLGKYNRTADSGIVLLIPFIEKIVGSKTNVVGFPVEFFNKLFKEFLA